MRYDIAVIGTGPAGLSAAVNAKNRNKSIIIFGKKNLSDKIISAHEINNYLGLYGMTGREVFEAFKNHIDKMGIEITEENVISVYPMGGYFSILSSDGMYESSTIILATGISFGTPLKGEKEFLGKGVSYCATCDAMFYRNKTVVVAGFSKESEAEAKFLSEVASKVYYVPYTDSEPSDTGKITVIHDKIIEITGEQKVTGVRFKESELQTDGVFILRDCIAPDSLIPGLKIENNRVCTDRKMCTNIPGCFAAGDITGTPYQYIKSAGEGNVAALSAVEYLSKK